MHQTDSSLEGSSHKSQQGSSGAGKRSDRRLSDTISAITSSKVRSLDQISIGNQQNKRPLTAVFSEDGASTSGQQQHNIIQANPRQSFLSKLTGSSSITSSTIQQKQSDTPSSQQSSSTSFGKSLQRDLSSDTINLRQQQQEFAGDDDDRDNVRAPAKSRHGNLPGESKIDRVMKLFTSPLSLRSNSSASQQFQPTFNSQEPLVTATTRKLDESQNMSFDTVKNIAEPIIAQAGSAGKSQIIVNKKSTSKSSLAYGCPLKIANNIDPITRFGRDEICKQQSIPYIITRLCNYIEENSNQLKREGIFRVSGNARLMDRFRTLFDNYGDAPLESESVDVATSASMLKLYLRELPEPLIPSQMNIHFINLARKYSSYLNGLRQSPDGNIRPTLKNQPSTSATSTATSSRITITTTTTTDKLSSTETSLTQQQQQTLPTTTILTSNDSQSEAFSNELAELVKKLPVENYSLLKYLACFLYRVSMWQQYNKMSAEALGIVFGPNIFRIRSESFKGLKEQELSNQIMASIISEYTIIFNSPITDPLGNLDDSLKGFIKPQESPHNKQEVELEQHEENSHKDVIKETTSSPGPSGPALQLRNESKLEQTGDNQDDEKISKKLNNDAHDCDKLRRLSSGSASSYCSLMNSVGPSELDEEDDDKFDDRDCDTKKKDCAGDLSKIASSSFVDGNNNTKRNHSHNPNDEKSSLSSLSKYQFIRRLSSSTSTTSMSRLRQARDFRDLQKVSYSEDKTFKHNQKQKVLSHLDSGNREVSIEQSSKTSSETCATTGDDDQCKIIGKIPDDSQPGTIELSGSLFPRTFNSDDTLLRSICYYEEEIAFTQDSPEIAALNYHHLNLITNFDLSKTLVAIQKAANNPKTTTPLETCLSEGQRLLTTAIGKGNNLRSLSNFIMKPAPRSKAATLQMTNDDDDDQSEIDPLSVIRLVRRSST